MAKALNPSILEAARCRACTSPGARTLTGRLGTGFTIRGMENFALIALVESLRPAMSDLVIRRVVQHQPNGFIFQTRSTRVPAFKVIADVQNPALYVSE